MEFRKGKRKNMFVGGILVDTVSSMLLNRGKGGDTEFQELVDTSLGQEVVEGTVRELEERYKGLQGDGREADSSSIVRISKSVFWEHAEKEFDNILFNMRGYKEISNNVELSWLVEPNRPVRKLELEIMLDSYLKIYTYYKLAYGVGARLSDMKELLVRSRGEVF